ncbi:MAG: hypothetical protein K0Q97_2653, partial [Bacillota bacterium]|nr:hypothetical protein [Bacillota bacterium]
SSKYVFISSISLLEATLASICFGISNGKLLHLKNIFPPYIPAAQKNPTGGSFSASKPNTTISHSKACTLLIKTKGAH